MSSSVRYIADSALTWHRQKYGKNFRYLDEDGKSIPDEDVERIKKLIIPPAWTEVRISPRANSHIQAVGFDAKGRKQYIYHPDWILENQQHKFDRMVRFGEVLPTLRETINGHMRQHTLTRERLLATVVWLLEHTFIRIGNKMYAQENKSYGLTTMREKHVSVEGNTVSFSFKGKSGVFHELDVSHPRIAKTIKQCLELPGYELFQYVDDEKVRQTIDSHDVNEYLQQISGESLSAKDFRTWGGTVMAGDTLYQIGNVDSATALKQALAQTAKEVSSHLGNTATVCRKYYIHPKILSSYEHHLLVPHFERMYRSAKAPYEGLSLEETAAWSLIKTN